MGATMAETRAAIKGVLDSVSGIGRTHDYARHLTTESEVKDELVTTAGILHAWWIALGDNSVSVTANSGSNARLYPANHQRRQYAFSIEGFYAVNDDDESEKLWQDIVEDVLATFTLPANRQLGLDDIITSGPVDWVEGGYRELARAYLVHYARLTIPVQVQVLP